MAVLRSVVLGILIVIASIALHAFVDHQLVEPLELGGAPRWASDSLGLLVPRVAVAAVVAVLPGPGRVRDTLLGLIPIYGEVVLWDRAR